MAETKKDPVIGAFEAVHSALKPLSAEDRERVLTSVRALLEMPIAGLSGERTVAPAPQTLFAPATSSPVRPLSLMELVNEKKPYTNAQRIALFAYYREKYEGRPRFGRDDLKPYFAQIHESPPGNYPRDFTEAVKRGWVHEDGTDSYITSTGIEAVEGGFTTEARSTRPSKRSIKRPTSGRSKSKSGTRRRGKP